MKESLFIIISFVFLLFLLILIFISYKSYENKRQPIVINSVKSALITSGTQLPSGVDLTPTPTLQELAEEISEINSLQYCNTKQCVVNLATGIKRCPSQQQSQLLYNLEEETCSDIFSCPSELPFAVLSDGQTNRFGQCDIGIACRCVAEESCALNVVDTFSVMGGNPNSSKQQFLNYNFQESNLLNDQGFDNQNIVIDVFSVGIQFCKLNPVYTERIQNGCNFACGDGDPIDCQQGAYVILNNDISITFKLSLLGQESLTKGQTFLHLVYVDKFPRKGILKLADSSNYITFSNAQTVNYKYQSNNVLDDDDYLSKKVIEISNIITNGIPGLQIDLSTTQKFFLEKIFFEFCSSQIGLENDRNMLNCIQTDEQPCKTGYLSYNVDKGNPRQFSQLQSPLENKNKLLPLRNLGNYLLDPSIYTVSCSVGNGCSKGLDLALCKPIDTIQIKTLIFIENGTTAILKIVYSQDQKYFPKTGDNITLFNIKDISVINISSLIINRTYVVTNIFTNNNTKEYTVQVNLTAPIVISKTVPLDYNAYMMSGTQTTLAARDCTQSVTNKKAGFFNSYDCAAMSNNWLLSNGSNTLGEQFKIVNDKLVIEEKNNLLELENGDYWSIYNQPINTFTSSAYDKGISYVIFNNVDYITPGMSFSYQGISTIENNSVISVNYNTKLIHMKTTLNTGVSVGQNFIFYNNLTANDYGLISNVEKIGTSYHAQTDNLTGTTVALSQTNNIYVYKQYGFNGINYNTTLDFSHATFGERFYSSNSYWNSFDNVLATSGDLKPPLSPINAIGIDFKDKTNTFLDSDANFKREKSMYFPIWNKNTFKQECIEPSPYLLAYPIIDNLTSVKYTQIQYSSKSFGEYIYDISGDYLYNTFSKLFPKQNYLTYQSTTDILILDEINPNIDIGDNLIDSNGNFETYMRLDPADQKFVLTGTSASLNVTIAENFYNLNDQLLEDKYNKFIYNGNELNDSNSEIKTFDGNTFKFTGSKQNYFLGKIYAGTHGGTSFTFSLVSNTNVVDIDNNLIQTDYGGISPITFSDNLIQFVKRDEKLLIDSEYSQDNSNSKSTGSELKIKVSSITDNRITNIDIVSGGTGYLNDNRPNLIVSKYKVSDPAIKNITIN